MYTYMRSNTPDDWGIKTLQEKILEIAVYVDQFCEENGIQYCLMGGSALGAIRHGGFIPWVEADDIMVRFDFALFLIFIELLIGFVARLCKTFGSTQDTVYVVFFSQLRSAVIIKYRFLCKLVILIYKIIERITITCIFTRYVFQDRHTIGHSPYYRSIHLIGISRKYRHVNLS